MLKLVICTMIGVSPMNAPVSNPMNKEMIMPEKVVLPKPEVKTSFEKKPRA